MRWVIVISKEIKNHPGDISEGTYMGISRDVSLRQENTPLIWMISYYGLGPRLRVRKWAEHQHPFLSAARLWIQCNQLSAVPAIMPPPP